jgi:uncharacterized membrane protein YdjX (TVP38/TMEM64 family)
MRPIVDFFLNMESKRWRALLATLVLFAVVVALFAFGKSFLGLGHGADGAEAKLEAWLSGFRSGPWGLVAAILLFTLSAFLGVPQFILIAACVVAFGPWFGFAYSWIATVASAAATYWLGRGPTARMVERFGGKTMGRMTRFVGKNAFYTSFMIRNVPSAPFIVVNMAFGAALGRRSGAFWQAAPWAFCLRPPWFPSSAERWFIGRQRGRRLDLSDPGRGRRGVAGSNAGRA